MDRSASKGNRRHYCKTSHSCETVVSIQTRQLGYIDHPESSGSYRNPAKRSKIGIQDALLLLLSLTDLLAVDPSHPHGKIQYCRTSGLVRDLPPFRRCCATSSPASAGAARRHFSPVPSKRGGRRLELVSLVQAFYVFGRQVRFVESHNDSVARYAKFVKDPGHWEASNGVMA